MAAMTQSDLRTLRETTVRRHVEAENSHDLAGTLATFDDPHYEVVPFASRFDGAEAVHNLLGDLMKAFPDFNAEILKMHHADDAVILEVQATGTQRAEWAGIVASSGRMDLPLLCIFQFDGDRLVCEKVYFDFATVMRQLAKP